MQHPRKIRSFFADSKYSADHGLLPHISVVTCVNRLYSKRNLIAEMRFVTVNFKQWALNANSSKTFKAADFKFDVRVCRDSLDTKT